MQKKALAYYYDFIYIKLGTKHSHWWKANLPKMITQFINVALFNWLKSKFEIIFKLSHVTMSKCYLTVKIIGNLVQK